MKQFQFQVRYDMSHILEVPCDNYEGSHHN